MRDLGVIKRSSCLYDVAKSSTYMSNIISIYKERERKKERKKERKRSNGIYYILKTIRNLAVVALHTFLSPRRTAVKSIHI